MPDDFWALFTLAEIRMVVFFSLALAAAYFDVRSRIIPDTICMLIGCVSLVPMEPIRLLGVFIAVPFLIAALTVGGMGGGDIKFVAASGMVLGLMQTLLGVIVGLLLLVSVHLIKGAMYFIGEKRCDKEVEQAYPLVPFLTAGFLLTVVLH